MTNFDAFKEPVNHMGGTYTPGFPLGSKGITEEPEPVENEERITQAEEPIEDRLHRAWLNGYHEGSVRAARGPRWDHS